MGLFADGELEKLTGLASAIKDDTKRANALALLDRMSQVIEGIGDREQTWRPTMIKVLQAMSKTEGIEGNTKPGALVAGNKVIPNGTKVIPLMAWISRTLWNEDENNAKRLCNSPDGKVGWAHGECKNCSFANSDTGIPPCNKEQSFLAVAEDFSDMYRMTFHKSQYRDGMDWSDMMRKSNTQPYKRMYTLTGADHAKKKTVKTIKVAMAEARGPILPVDEMAFLEGMFQKQMNDRKIYLEKYRAKVMEGRIDVKELSHDGHEAPALADNSESSQAESGRRSTPNYNL